LHGVETDGESLAHPLEMFIRRVFFQNPQRRGFPAATATGLRSTVPAEKTFPPQDVVHDVAVDRHRAPNGHPAADNFAERGHVPV